MLASGGKDGVAYSAETAKQSREAIFNILDGEQVEGTSSISDRFPTQIEWGEDKKVLPIAEWNEKLRALGEQSWFEKAVSMKTKALDKFMNGLANQETLNIDALMSLVEADKSETDHDGTGI